jgi:uncharacterized membrane protein
MTNDARTMSLRTPVLISLFIVAVMGAVSLWDWGEIPSGQNMPVHWNLHGEIDGWAPKEQALLFLPGTALLLSILMAVLPRFDPRRSNLAKSAKLYIVGWIGGLVVLLGAHVAIILAAMGVAVPIDRLVPPTIGIFFAVLGNYLGKTRSNFFAGVRTPWTLSSEYSWEKTHRLAGRLFVVTGIVTVILSLFTSAPWPLYGLLAGVFIAVAISLVMSYVYWRRDPDRQSHSAVNGA